MKKIGLIGGMSWESSAVYYSLLNEEVRRKLGGFHSCDCVMDSVDFAEIEKLQHEGNWKKLCEIMHEKAMNLKEAGAEIILLCTNTMHLCSEQIEKNLGVPFLHIAETTGHEIRKQGLDSVALLGTKFTMEADFYIKTLENEFDLDVLIPGSEDRQLIHDCIYQELVLGVISEESKQVFLAIINRLVQRGAQGIVLGCTEIPLLIHQEDLDVPVFDTTSIHAKYAVNWALAK